MSCIHPQITLGELAQELVARGIGSNVRLGDLFIFADAWSSLTFMHRDGLVVRKPNQWAPAVFLECACKYRRMASPECPVDTLADSVS
jgi:hypothetical protein